MKHANNQNPLYPPKKDSMTKEFISTIIIVAVCIALVFGITGYVHGTLAIDVGGSGYQKEVITSNKVSLVRGDWRILYAVNESSERLLSADELMRKSASYTPSQNVVHLAFYGNNNYEFYGDWLSKNRESGTYVVKEDSVILKPTSSSHIKLEITYDDNSNLILNWKVSLTNSTESKDDDENILIYFYDMSSYTNNSDYDNEDESDTYTEEDTSPIYTNDTSQDYIIPTSNVRRISKSELEGISKLALRLAINEVYARHGYVFRTNQMLADYFNSKEWYRDIIAQYSTTDMESITFSDIEDDNLKTMVAYKKNQGWSW